MSDDDDSDFVCSDHSESSVSFLDANKSRRLESVVSRAARKRVEIASKKPSARAGNKSKRQKIETCTIDDFDDQFSASSVDSNAHYDDYNGSSEDGSRINEIVKEARTMVAACVKNLDCSMHDDHDYQEDRVKVHRSGPIVQSISYSNLSETSLYKARKPPWKPQPPTSEDGEAYIENLERNIEKRRFPLAQIPKHQVISTGRTIKPLKAWKGFWPLLREFLQNTVDHLNLMDGKTGRRKSCLTMEAKKSDEKSTITFMCQDRDICKFIVSSDELVIEQQFTYPIPSRSLDTGVVDTSKISNSNQAGGFGDGFKTAAVALISNSKGKGSTSLQWFFHALEEKTKISWNFEGLTKESIGTFAESEVLQVVIDKMNISEKEIAKLKKKSSCNYIMTQVIKAKNIGTAFLEKAVPMFSVFWELDEGSLISTQGKNKRGLGGDFIGPASSQPPLFNGVFGLSLKPKSGVYVRGIWIRNSKIQDSIMSFYGNRLEVTGRDRNEVNDEELLNATIYVLHRCNDSEYLRMLLTPLRQGANSTNSSWLLKSPAFFNRVIEHEKDFIRHTVLRIPTNSVFISDKTAKKKDPFFMWASELLRSHNTPLILIEKGSNKYLFEELDEYELTGRCVEIIKSSMKGSRKKGSSHSIFTKFLSYLGVRQAKVIFSRDVSLAFVHDRNIYIPECRLSREFIIRVLNVCHSQLEAVKPENYSSLLEAVLKTMSARGQQCTTDEATRIVNRAKQIQKECSNFLHRTNIVSERISDEEDIVPYGSGDENVYTKALQELLAKTDTDSTSSKSDVRGGAYGLDDTDGGDCLPPLSSFSVVRVGSKFGGGSILCDASTARKIKSNIFDKEKRERISILRGAFDEAMGIIENSLPFLSSLLDKVNVGYDGGNDSYEGFYDGEEGKVFINIYAFFSKLEKKAYPRTLIHDFVTVVTHELAHAMITDDEHGPRWRACHMNMIMQVMATLEMSDA